jgi:hypothetical protein
MRTRIIEAVQSLEHPGNWGKFLLGEPDTEWLRESKADPAGGWPLLGRIGWTAQHLWVLDLQTGEGAFFRPGGSARADLEKHRVWVCPLFEPFLEWLYDRYLEDPRLDIGSLPDVIELPGAEFAFAGYRRPGPEEARLCPPPPESPCPGRRPCGLRLPLSPSRSRSRQGTETGQRRTDMYGQNHRYCRNCGHAVHSGFGQSCPGLGGVDFPI